MSNNKDGANDRINSRRRNTIHDLTSLRLHPDGTRVKNKDKVKEKVRAAAYTVKDRQGNWIAHDAGGSATVKVLRKKRKRDTGADSDVGGEVFDLDVEEVQEGEDNEQDGSARKKKTPLKDPRALKRKQFYDDLVNLSTDNLAISSSSYKIHYVDDEPVLPLPSSDLLKCIHHFASELYSSRGELYNAPKEAREEKKARRLIKQQKGNSELRSSEAPEPSEEGLDEEEGGDEGLSGKDDDGEYIDIDDGSQEVMKPSGSGKHASTLDRKRGKLKNDLKRDMYRSFDGSALIAIGMLIQEHIITQMNLPKLRGEEDEVVEDSNTRNIKGHQELSDLENGLENLNDVATDSAKQ